MKKIILFILLSVLILGCKSREIQDFSSDKTGIKFKGFSDFVIKEDSGEIFNAYDEDFGFLIQKIWYDDLDSNTNFIKILNEKTQQIALEKKINISVQNSNDFQTNTLTGIYFSGAGDGKGIYWIFGVCEPSYAVKDEFCYFFVISYTEKSKLEAKEVILKSIETSAKPAI